MRWLAYNQTGTSFDLLWNSSRPSISVWTEWIGGSQRIAIREDIGPDEDLISIVLQVSADARQALDSGQFHYMPEIGEGAVWLAANAYNGHAYTFGYMSDVADLGGFEGYWDAPEEMAVGMSNSEHWPPHRDLWWSMLYDTDQFRDLFTTDVVNVALDDLSYTHPDADLDAEVWEIYRGISLPKGETPATSSKGEGYDLGYAWTVSQDVAMSIAERGMAGFNTDQIVGDVYVMYGDDRKDKVPWVLRAEISGEDANLYFPFGGANYASEQEIEVTKGTPLLLTGYMAAEAVFVAEWEPVTYNGEPGVKTDYEKDWFFGRYEWPGYWTEVRQERTA